MEVLSAFSLTSPYNADDGVVAKAGTWNLNDFNNIVPPHSIPSGIVVECKLGSAPSIHPSIAQFTVNNGTSISVPKVINEQAHVGYPTLGVVTVGSTTDLWGLPWTEQTLRTIRVDMSMAVGNVGYWDYVKVYIYFNPDPQPGILINEGLVMITATAVVGKSGLVKIN